MPRVAVHDRECGLLAGPSSKVLALRMLGRVRRGCLAAIADDALRRGYLEDIADPAAILRLATAWHEAPSGRSSPDE